MARAPPPDSPGPLISPRDPQTLPTSPGPCAGLPLPLSAGAVSSFSLCLSVCLSCLLLSLSHHPCSSPSVSLTVFVTGSLPFPSPSLSVSTCLSLPGSYHLCLLPQVLNEYFHNVCELDLVFNFYKVGWGGGGGGTGRGRGGGPPGASAPVRFLALWPQGFRLAPVGGDGGGGEGPPSPRGLPDLPPFPLPLPPSPAQVYTVVDEMFLAGEIRETSQTKVLKQLLMLQSLE